MNVLGRATDLTFIDNKGFESALWPDGAQHQPKYKEGEEPERGGASAATRGGGGLRGNLGGTCLATQ